MNIVDELMKIDAGKVKRIEKDIELYLSRIDKTLTFHCIELDQEEATRLSEETLNVTMSGDVEISTFKMKIETILLGCPGVFQNKELQAKFGCVTALDLIKKLLTNAEINELSDFIHDLGASKKDKKAVEKIKN